MNVKNTPSVFHLVKVILLLMISLLDYQSSSSSLIESSRIQTSYLVIRPHSGLCNQLSAIAHGMIIASLTNRSLIIDGFLVEYNKYSNHHSLDPHLNLMIGRVFARDVYDCEHLQLYVSKSMGLNPFPIHCDWSNWLHEKNTTGNFKVLHHQNRYNGRKVVETLRTSEYNTTTFVDIGHSFHMFFDYHEYSDAMFLKHVKFTPLFYDIAKERYDRLVLHHPVMNTNTSANSQAMTNVIGLHLRLEDDMMTNGEFLKEPSIHLQFQAKSRYVEMINNNTTSLESLSIINQIFRTEFKNALYSSGINNNTIIYVCSGLRNGISVQMNDDIFDEWKTEFPGLVYEKGDSNLYGPLTHYKNGREILAIIDLVFLELYTNQFIGVSHSTFSVTAKHRIVDQSKVKLLKLFSWTAS